MKQTMPTAGLASRPSRAAAKQARAMVRAKRTWHQRLLLHPLSVMVLLCAGVLIVGATFRGYAVSYDVTATVPAPAITQPAVIQTPTPLMHTSASTITVNGSCSPQSYVKLFRNGTFSGVSQCSANSFQIQTSLDSGANELDPQVYNLTDQPGPAGAHVTVYYDPVTPPSPAPAPPAGVPTTVSIVGIDNTVYTQGSVVQASDNPTVNGWAPPFSQVLVTFHSDPLTCLTTADSTGWWTCTLDHPLPVGIHHVDVSVTTPTGQKLTAPTFQITVVASKRTVLVNDAGLLDIRGDYQYKMIQNGEEATFTVGLIGGKAPYNLSVDWADGTHSSLTRSDQNAFNIIHKYRMLAEQDKTYPVLIMATDASGNSALLQLDVTVRGAAKAAAVTSLFGDVHHWLWVMWPMYGVVVLMAIGYYLGEREEYHRLMHASHPVHTNRAGRA